MVNDFYVKINNKMVWDFMLNLAVQSGYRIPLSWDGKWSDDWKDIKTVYMHFRADKSISYWLDYVPRSYDPLTQLGEILLQLEPPVKKVEVVVACRKFVFENGAMIFVSSPEEFGCSSGHEFGKEYLREVVEARQAFLNQPSPPFNEFCIKVQNEVTWNLVTRLARSMGCTWPYRKSDYNVEWKYINKTDGCLRIDKDKALHHATTEYYRNRNVSVILDSHVELGKIIKLLEPNLPSVLTFREFLFHSDGRVERGCFKITGKDWDKLAEARNSSITGV